MNKIQAILRRCRLQYRPNNPLHTVVVSAAIALSLVTLVTLHLGYVSAAEQLEQLNRQAAVLEQENAGLRERIDGIGTSDAIREIAREELGLVDPDTIIIEQED